MKKRTSLYRKMIKKKKLLYVEMDELDQINLNTVLQYLERFVLLFDGPIPEEYKNVLDRLRSVIPIEIQNTKYSLGTTPICIGNAVYRAAYGVGQMSLNQSLELKNIVNETMELFEQYRQVSPPAIDLDSSSALTSPSTLSGQRSETENSSPSERSFVK